MIRTWKIIAEEGVRELQRGEGIGHGSLEEHLGVADDQRKLGFREVFDEMGHTLEFPVLGFYLCKQSESILCVRVALIFHTIQLEVIQDPNQGQSDLSVRSQLEET